MFGKIMIEAWQNLMLHKMRSSLAALGIIFGVASVICMLSISEVARQDVINRMERMGLRNVVLDSHKPEGVRKREASRSDESWIATYGVTIKDLDILRQNVPEIDDILPMRVMLKDVQADLNTSDISVVSTTPSYPRVMEHETIDGRFLSATDESNALAVCTLGYDAARELFPLTSPIDRVVKIGGTHFTVVGVMARKGQTGNSGLLANPDRTAYIPFSTSFARFGKLQIKLGSGTQEATQVEINRAVLRVREASLLVPIAQIARNLMEKNHRQSDVEVTIPYTLLKEHRQSERIFRWVMSSLAAISLLVGGVGIMNIMLANMSERRQEIGVRRALGASRGDIVRLFLSESTVLCLFGGLVGMGAGAGLATAIGTLAQWTVVFQPLSFPFGLGVSLMTGLIFGTLPALKAARMDPVLALRVE